VSDLRELTSGRAIRLVAGRELTTRLRSKAFLWTTVALVVGIVLGGLVIHFASGHSTPSAKVGLLPGASAVAAPLVADGTAAGVKIHTVEVSDQQTGEAQLRSGDLTALVTTTTPGLAVTVKQKVSDPLGVAFRTLAQQVALSSAVTDLGGDPQQVGKQIAGATPHLTTLEAPKQQDSGQIVAGYIVGILMFLTLMITGQLVAQGVVEEKSSRVVELLLAALRPWQLMAGKVLGIGVTGLIQVVVVAAGGAATAIAFDLLHASSLSLGSTVVWSLIWFMVGFVLLALLIAALASLVSRQEDVGQVIAPAIGLLVLPYIVGISIAPWDPTNPIVTWMSFIPFCSALIMPMRIALGVAPTWQILVSLAISLALVPVLVWFAGRVYSGAVLHQGTRLHLRDALSPQD
jgi:ABC-2 type transport system permease protein